MVAIAADTGQLIAHAGLERDPSQPDRAEFALVVADRYQNRGLGRVLLDRLVEAARRVGIQRLTAEVLGENQRMLNLLRHARYPVRLRFERPFPPGMTPLRARRRWWLVTEPHDWPPEQSAHGALRPWHATAAGYLAVLFEDPEEAQQAQRGLQQHGVPAGNLRLYDGEETLRIASRLQQERSVLTRAINEVVVDRGLRERWLANARAGGSLLWIYARPRTGPTGWWGCWPTTVMGRCATSARTV